LLLLDLSEEIRGRDQRRSWSTDIKISNSACQKPFPVEILLDPKDSTTMTTREETVYRVTIDS
jgi:hypothetical protein